MEAAKRILEVQVLVSKAEVGDKNYLLLTNLLRYVHRRLQNCEYFERCK